MSVRRAPIYYGWYVLAASAVSEMLVMGATSYAAGLFVLPLQAEFHLSRADASSAILFLYCGSILAAPLVGRLLDRWPIRLVVGAGAILLTAALCAIAFSNAVPVMIAVLLVPAALAYTALGPLTTSTLASRWFYRRRGLALGIAAVSTSGGGFTVVPLLSLAIQHFGWRQALFYESLAIGAVIALLALLVLRDSPGAMGLEDADENRGRPQHEIASGGEPARLREIVKQSSFWIPSLTLATISGTSQATVSILVPYAVGMGLSPTRAALLISAFAATAGTAKVLAGLMADYINPRFMLIAAALLMMLSWTVLSGFSGYPFLFAASCLAGAALGCALPTTNALIAAAFGSHRFASVTGWTYMLIFSFAIAAVRFSGSVYDSAASYTPAFQTFAVLLACLLLATLYFARRRTAA